MLPPTDLHPLLFYSPHPPPGELWVMFNSRSVTAVDPHGNWISPPLSFVRLVQVKGEDVGC